MTDDINALGNFEKKMDSDYSMGKFIKSTKELQWPITYDRPVQITIYRNTL